MKSIKFQIGFKWTKISKNAAIPDFPVQKRKTREEELREQTIEETRKRPAYVYSWLPPFPDPHTYSDTPVRIKFIVKDQHIIPLKIRHQRLKKKPLKILEN